MIQTILSIFGACWIFTVILIAIFGGSVVIKIRNPFSKTIETVTEVSIEHGNKNE